MTDEEQERFVTAERESFAALSPCDEQHELLASLECLGAIVAVGQLHEARRCALLAGTRWRERIERALAETAGGEVRAALTDVLETIAWSSGELTEADIAEVVEAFRVRTRHELQRIGAEAIGLHLSGAHEGTLKTFDSRMRDQRECLGDVYRGRHQANMWAIERYRSRLW